MLTCFSKTDLELMVGKDEKVLWAGRPDKLCFVLEGIFNPMLPFALIWFLIDSVFLIFFTVGAGGISQSPELIFPLILYLFI